MERAEEVQRLLTWEERWEGRLGAAVPLERLEEAQGLSEREAGEWKTSAEEAEAARDR